MGADKKERRQSLPERLPTLWTFIDQGIARAGNFFPRNSYVTCHGFKELYVRYTKRVFDGEILAPTLDLARIEAWKPGTGAFGRLFKKLRTEYPQLHLFVEMTHERFGDHLVKLGFIKLNTSHLTRDDNYIFKAV